RGAPGAPRDRGDVPRIVPARARHSCGRRTGATAVVLHPRDQAPGVRVHSSLTRRTQGIPVKPVLGRLGAPTRRASGDEGGADRIAAPHPAGTTVPVVKYAQVLPATSCPSRQAYGP